MSSTEPASDDEKLALHAQALSDGLLAHTPAWVEGIVRARLEPARVGPVTATLAADIERVLGEVVDLLAADIDAQRANPLALVRSLVPAMTAALRSEGLVGVRRDADAERLFPDDVFDLTPGSFSDVHPELHLPGLTWGAAKAHVHLQRRRAEGLR